MDQSSRPRSGDTQHSELFEEYLPKVYARRRAAGLDDVVHRMAAVVVQVEHGDAIDYVAELAVMGPYRFRRARLTATHRVFLLESQPQYPRFVVLEPLSPAYEDAVTRCSLRHPLARRKPNARYVGEVYAADSVKDVRGILESQHVRVVQPGDTANAFYALDHLTFTGLSDVTSDRVGYVDVPIDDLDALGVGEELLLTARERGALDRADEVQAAHGLRGLVLGLDHTATRVLANEREDALLEYLSLVPYDFGGASTIAEVNASTSVTRHPDVTDDKESPARVFTASGAPAVVGSFAGLPMATEDFVRNFGRRTHHLAVAVGNGEARTDAGLVHVVRELSAIGTPFLARVVGGCQDGPDLKQAFSRSSRYSLLITEYVERCDGFDGFFTRSNVTALLAAAGAEERYEHGHVFD